MTTSYSDVLWISKTFRQSEMDKVMAYTEENSNRLE